MHGIIIIICILLIVFAVDYILFLVFRHKEKSFMYRSNLYKAAFFCEYQNVKYLPTTIVQHRKSNRFIIDDLPIDTVGKGINLLRADGYRLSYIKY